MEGIGKKGFEYYENKGSYFEYTHDEDAYEEEELYEHLEYERTVAKVIRERAAQDRRENIPARDIDQLVEFIISEGLLSPKKIDSFKNEIIMDYSLAYDR